MTKKILSFPFLAIVLFAIASSVVNKKDKEDENVTKNTYALVVDMKGIYKEDTSLQKIFVQEQLELLCKDTASRQGKVGVMICVIE